MSNVTSRSGIISILANAHSTSSFGGKRYYFRGDLCQMFAAQKAAKALGIQTDIEGGLPFVMSQEDFDSVKEYLISNRIEGWWHYVTYEEYCEMEGRYIFGGNIRYQKEIQRIADNLGILLQGKDSEVLFATSKADFNAIVEKLESKG